MATLREAIEYSRNNPSDPRAKALYQAIKSGGMDDKALQEGVDLSWAGRMKTGPQFQAQSLGSIGVLDEVGQPDTIGDKLKESGQDVVQEVEGLISDFKNRGEVALDALKRGRVGGEITPLEGGFQAGVQTVGAFNDMVGRAVRTVTKLGLSQEDEQAVKNGLQIIMQKTKITDAIQAYEGWKEENPRLAENVEAVGTLAEFFADIWGVGIARKGTGEGLDVAKNITTQAGKETTDVVRQIGRESVDLAKDITKVVGNTPRALRDQIVKIKYGDDGAKAIAELEKAYSEIPLPKGIVQMESQTGKSFARFMAEHPHTKIDVKDMKYDTYNVAQQLRKEAGVEAEALQALLRDRVEMVSLDKIMDDVKQAVTKTTAGQERNAALRYIENEFEAFKQQNSKLLHAGDQMKLADANKLKQELWDRSPFNPTASRQDRLSSSIDYKMGQAFRQNIEDAIPDVDLKGLNAELGDYYHSISILERLHGGAAPRGRIGIEFARMGGAIAGTPAGIMGSIVGYMTADKIAKVLVSESLGQNFRRYAVSQLMEKRPSVASQVLEILEKEQGLRATRELLPEGAIPMGPATTQSTMEVLTPERFNPAPQSPETGKFFKAFKSTGKDTNIQPGLSMQDITKLEIYPEDLTLFRRVADDIKAGKKVTPEVMKNLEDTMDAYRISIPSNKKNLGNHLQNILDAQEKVQDVKFNKSIGDTADFKTSAKTKTTDLLEEAKKYKTADEFVKAQGTRIHQDLREIYEMAESPKEFGEDMAEMFERYQRQIGELPTYASTEALEMLRTADDFALGTKASEIQPTHGNTFSRTAIEKKKELIQSGKASPLVYLDDKGEIIDGNHALIAYKELGYDIIPTIKPIKTRSQLEDMWKQANNNTSNANNIIVADAVRERMPNLFEPPDGFALQKVKVADIKPSQTGEDYINASSKHAAEMIAKGDAENIRPQDVAPIKIDKGGVIIDGNHRHAAATMNGDEYIYAFVEK